VLPPLWFDQLDDLRSKFTQVDGRWVRLEKFSSMGNGFTFELETLIFAALTCAAVRENGGLGQLGKDVFVFGDDIIAPDSQFRNVESVLKYFGFALNEEKSFYGAVPFRESCGGDYFAGQPVRGYYLKQLPRGPEDSIPMANGIYAMAERLRTVGYEMPRRAWFSVLDTLPSRVRQCRGPKALGDTVIWDDDVRFWKTRERHGIRYFQAFRPWKMRVTPFSVFSGEVVLACATYGTGSYRGGVIPRDGVQSYKVGMVPYS